MAAVLTNLYLEPGQRKFLEKQAKTNGTNTRSKAGKIYDVDADGGVWVQINYGIV